MKNNIEFCIKHILGDEGGYVEHPKDPGGATNRGITHITLANYRCTSVTRQDVKDLTETEAVAIYRKNYWNKVKCDDLPSGLDLCVFDSAVNQGVGRAAKFLQQAANTIGRSRLTVDCRVGPKTIEAVNSCELLPLMEEFMALRMHHYGNLGIFSSFGLGWSRRLIGTLTTALSLDV